MKVHVSRSSSVPMVTAEGEHLVSLAGVGMLSEAADLSSLTAGLSGLFRAQGHVWRRHAPGVTLVRAAAAIADGMRNISSVSLFCSSRKRFPLARRRSPSGQAPTECAHIPAHIPHNLRQVADDRIPNRFACPPRRAKCFYRSFASRCRPRPLRQRPC